MRIAFIDLVFSWPPKGGADVDAYHVLQQLQALGHEVQLIGVSCEGIGDRNGFEEQALPFPAVCHAFTRRSFTRGTVLSRIQKTATAWKPDVILLGDVFFLKPLLAEALRDYPLAARYYAYEMACHRDVLRFRDGAPCPYNYLKTPEECRRCALAFLGPDLKRDHLLAWTQEYLSAEAYHPRYYGETLHGLQQVDAAIVYNTEMQRLLEPHIPQVFIVPGGVDDQFLDSVASVDAAPDQEVTIFMAGRGEDPAKGLSILLQAGELLARTRSDILIQATAPEDTQAPPWFQPLGWRAHSDLPALYAQAGISVVPSIWDEPFGMVAVEAMAAGLPVCASRVGGLQHIVRHGETGFLFTRGDSAELAQFLALLLDDPALRQSMGSKGRRLVQENYTWRTIVERHYTPILEYLMTCRKS